MKRIFEGFYYPVIGKNNGWESYDTKQIIERRFGGWENWEKWWSFSYGVKCRLKDPKKPYKDFVIKDIKKHPEMKIVTEYFDENGEQIDQKNDSSIILTSVYTKDNKYIGDIRTAYNCINLIDFRSSEGSNVICAGYDPINRIAYGWSHRAKVGFKEGDRIFEADYGDDKTLYTEHGSKIIHTKEDAMRSALNFADYVG